MNVWISDDKPLKTMLVPTINHAVPYVYYRRNDAEKGGNAEAAGKKERTATQAASCHPPLVIIQAEGNRGFAGGNNIGMRYALNKDDAEYIWLLNNDTVVREDTLTHLVKKMQESVETGAVGSVHLDYLHPNTVQTIGGSIYLKYIGFTKSLRKNELYSPRLVEKMKDTADIDFVSGCSILIRKVVLARTGLLDEDFFVYWEDADWSERIKRAGFSLRYSMESVVFHKHGQSSSPAVSSYFSTLNCFKFYRKHHPLLLPLIFINRLPFIVMIGIKTRNTGYVRGAFRAYGDFLKNLF